MRLFLAVPLDESFKAALAQTQARLQAASDVDVKWVEAGTLHLTVHFLGDVSAPLLPDIESACENLAKSAAPFRVGVRGVSVFPKRGPQIKTIWAAVTDGASEWKTLARAAEAALVPLGAAKPNSELVPHLTLGRVKSDKNMDALRSAIASEAQTDFGTQTAGQLVLMQSFLNPSPRAARSDGGGAVHETVRTWNLASG